MSIKSKISQYYVFKFFSNLYFDRSNFIFFLGSAGLTGGQIGLLQSVYFWVNLLTEVPTGLVADHISKRFSVSLGCFLMGCVFFLFPILDSFLGFVLVLSLFAVAVSLRSGAENALIYEELLIEGKEWESKSNKIFNTGNSLSLYAIGIASIIGSYLMTKSWKHVYWTLSAVMFLSAIISFNFKETFKEKKKSESKEHKEFILVSLIKFIKSEKNYKHLLFVSGVAIVFSIQNPVFVFSQALLKHIGLESHEASLTIAMIFILSASINILISKYSFWETRKFFYFLFMLVSGSYFVTPYTKSTILIAIIVGLSSTIQSLILVYTESYLNKVVSSEVRASFLSVNFFIISLFSAISLPLYGFFVDLYGPHIVFKYIWPIPLLGLIVVYLFMAKPDRKAI